MDHDNTKFKRIQIILSGSSIKLDMAWTARKYVCLNGLLTMIDLKTVIFCCAFNLVISYRDILGKC